MGNALSEFLAGFVAGLVLIGTEVQIFAFGLLVEAFSKILSSMPQSSVSTPNITWVYFAVVAGEMLQNFLIGYLGPEAFAYGFLFGDLLIIIILGVTLLSVIPEVLVGLALGFVCVFLGLYYKPRH